MQRSSAARGASALLLLALLARQLQAFDGEWCVCWGGGGLGCTASARTQCDWLACRARACGQRSSGTSAVPPRRGCTAPGANVVRMSTHTGYGPALPGSYARSCPPGDRSCFQLACPPGQGRCAAVAGQPAGAAGAWRLLPRRCLTACMLLSTPHRDQPNQPCSPCPYGTYNPGVHTRVCACRLHTQHQVQQAPCGCVALPANC
jgi:hypothetical protein